MVVGCCGWLMLGKSGSAQRARGSAVLMHCRLALSQLIIPIALNNLSVRLVYQLQRNDREVAAFQFSSCKFKNIEFLLLRTNVSDCFRTIYINMKLQLRRKHLRQSLIRARKVGSALHAALGNRDICNSDNFTSHLSLTSGRSCRFEVAWAAHAQFDAPDWTRARLKSLRPSTAGEVQLRTIIESVFSTEKGFFRVTQCRFSSGLPTLGKTW